MNTSPDAFVATLTDLETGEFLGEVSVKGEPTDNSFVSHFHCRVHVPTVPDTYVVVKDFANQRTAWHVISQALQLARYDRLSQQQIEDYHNV